MTPDDISRLVRSWLVEVSAEFQPVAHDGPCRERIPAPCGADTGDLLPAERLQNGGVVCHGCGQTFQPGQPVLCLRERPE